MRVFLCILNGYLLGSLSPAAFFSKLKDTNLREKGTGNLGASNTMLVMGRTYGILVALFDIAKAFVSVRLGSWLVPTLACAGILSGAFAVVGHIFPFYMHFRGGKGLAAFGGLLLAVDPFLFFILLAAAVGVMIAVNYSVGAPMTAAILFPLLYRLRHDDLFSVIIAVAVSLLLIGVHISNIERAARGDEMKVRDFLMRHLSAKEETVSDDVK
ncbi:MAG: glycerol-3-phosphate acyltransferase [Lachnospiraceae bacterium]|nr:glycerol-3-phosphate acyltransferase [Lachnospiraceae bacterium]